MKVGFIGLGTMGASMAANAIRGGNDLVVHDIDPESATPPPGIGSNLGRHTEAGGRTVRDRLHVTARPAGGRGGRAWRGRHRRGHEPEQSLLRPQYELAHADSADSSDLQAFGWELASQ